jgi:hypothetical protein
MRCYKCGGKMILINQYLDTYLCDTCDFEFDLDGVINEGEFDKQYKPIKINE